VLHNHPHRPLADLRRIAVAVPSRHHGSFLSRVGASDNPGAVHFTLVIGQGSEATVG
jgi:hypothetical protein